MKRLVNLDRCTPGIVAQSCGVERETVDAWARPKQSDEYPAGSGKNNPSDAVVRLLGMAHEEDPGLAREWAEMFVAYVDYRDGKTVNGSAKKGVCEVAAIYLKEHAEMVAEILRKGELENIWTELAQCEAAFNKLKACLKEEMKVEPEVRKQMRELVNGKSELKAV